MVTLRDYLDDSTKARRHRSNLLNIQITILAWLIEFMGFFFFFLGSFFVGQRSKIAIFFFQILTITYNFILLPSIFLIDNSHRKSSIVDSSWYFALIHRLSPQPSIELDQIDSNEGSDDGIEGRHEPMKTNEEPKQDIEDEDYKEGNDHSSVTQ